MPPTVPPTIAGVLGFGGGGGGGGDGHGDPVGVCDQVGGWEVVFVGWRIVALKRLSTSMFCQPDVGRSCLGSVTNPATTFGGAYLLGV